MRSPFNIVIPAQAGIQGKTSKCYWMPASAGMTGNMRVSREYNMELLAGTSGYSYKEWLGSFYPDKLPADQMLRYYAGHFRTVEINNTFYRMPAEAMLARWAGEVPENFAFTLKAPRRITHDSRLRNCGELVTSFCRVAGTLDDKLGALLFQLPPNLKKDLPLFDAFLAARANSH